MHVLSRGVVTGKGHGAAAAAAGIALLGWSPRRGYINIIPKTRYPATHVRVVDLRSDAVTRPGPAMLQAMAVAAANGKLVTEDPMIEGKNRTVVVKLYF